MVRPAPWLLLLLLLLVLPTPIGRLLLNLVGGLTLTLLLLPLLGGAVAVIGWQVLKRRLRTCPSCGVINLGQPVCPACGTLIDFGKDGEAAPAGTQGSRLAWGWEKPAADIDPRNVTINVEAVDVEPTEGDSPRPS